MYPTGLHAAIWSCCYSCSTSGKESASELPWLLHAKRCSDRLTQAAAMHAHRLPPSQTARRAGGVLVGWLGLHCPHQKLHPSNSCGDRPRRAQCQHQPRTLLFSPLT